MPGRGPRAGTKKQSQKVGKATLCSHAGFLFLIFHDHGEMTAVTGLIIPQAA